MSESDHRRIELVGFGEFGDLFEAVRDLVGIGSEKLREILGDYANGFGGMRGCVDEIEEESEELRDSLPFLGMISLKGAITSGCE